jgi:hypothetical protein
MGAFRNSMDFRYRPVSYTPSRSKVDKDGKVRFVMTHADPGYHNWIDTQSFVTGALTYRNLLSTNSVTLKTKVVKVAKLDQELPADSARCTGEERVAQMWARFNSIRQRYSL